MSVVPPVLDCPLPPPDFDKRDLPVVALALDVDPLYRIHRTVRDPVFFNHPSVTGATYRFDSPDNAYGVLYAAETLEVCLQETLIRDTFHGQALPFLIDEQEVAVRAFSRLCTESGKPLILADLTAGLTWLGGDARIWTTADYTGPNQWSKAVHDHPANIDGMLFISRFSQQPAIAIFNRVGIVSAGAPEELIRSHAVAAFFDKHNISFAPPGC